MLEPRVKGVNERNEAYEFVANSATQPSKNAEVMYLDRVRGRVQGVDGKITTLTAPDAVHNTKADEMTFNNGVVVKQEPGMTATFQTATAFMKQQLVVSKTPVIVRLHESTIHAEAMTLHWGDQQIVFEGNVRTHLERQPAGADAGKPFAAERPASEWRPATGGAAIVWRENQVTFWRRADRRQKIGLGAAAILALAMPLAPALGQTPVSGFSAVGGANSQKPIDIESDRLEVDDKKHLAIFIGNVSATQGDYNLRAPRIEVTYEKAPDAREDQGKTQGSKPVKAAPPSSAPQPRSADVSADPMASGQIKFIHATGGKVVVISKKDEQEVTGEDAIYDVKGQKITMTGKEVILTQKKNVVRGKQLDIDLATGRATVIPEKGRVQAIFSQDSAKGIISADQFIGVKKRTKSQRQRPRSILSHCPVGSLRAINVQNGWKEFPWLLSIGVSLSRDRSNSVSGVRSFSPSCRRIWSRAKA